MPEKAKLDKRLAANKGITPNLWELTLNKRLSCNQQGLDNCKISNCSDKRMVVRTYQAPTGPEWHNNEQLGTGQDKHGLVPVVNVTWKLKADASVLKFFGSEINIVDESTNQSICMQYLSRIPGQLNPSNHKWTFSLDEVVVEPGHTYVVSVFNLPEPEGAEKAIIRKSLTIPGCTDSRIQMAQLCLENGSLWNPHITTDVSVDREHQKMYIVVGFEVALYSERYQVSIQNPTFSHVKDLSKGNGTSLNVTLEVDLWKVSECDLLLTIQPFFTRCKNDCWRPRRTIDYCHYYPPRTLIIKATAGLLIVNVFLVYLLWRAIHKGPVKASSSAANEQSEGFQVQERKRVLIIYSLDHPLYKNIVLKLCGFLATKCGTEVVLDLLDCTRLGVLGSIQWLDWHRQQIQSSSDKILILCSPGVQAKWKAMCGDKQVFLREDALSPVGDMLTPALSLIVPHFIRSASYEKYIVAYFDDVCSEEDVPSPFNITVRYKLMNQFEELFFRILDTEKHRPGAVNHIEGLSEDDYHQCLSGNTNLITYCVPDSTQVINHVKTQGSGFTAEKTGLYTEQLQLFSSAEFDPLI
ncbi:hypothetical protein Q5P01_012702 [Channa striata]|uniref:SEFIR domain-containing protein n=1 Tax=Channa striata TaxID=64152 RepID=A0AA88MQ16_CHASR|nr:hypothetical protein Q5P01_012702 [Channa striata]